MLGGQFHDILPGTSLPQAYQFSWNDEVLAQNQFADVLQSAAARGGRRAWTRRGAAHAVVVYNPLSIERQDVVEISISLRPDSDG